MPILQSGAKSGIRPEIIVYGVLCVLVFLTGIGMTQRAFYNAALMSVGEIAFVLFYVALIGSPLTFSRLVLENKAISGLLILFGVSVTVSLYLSPYNLSEEPLGKARYLQTLMHVVTFVVIRDMFLRFDLQRRWLLLSISLACLTVALGFAVMWWFADSLTERDVGFWFWQAPEDWLALPPDERTLEGLWFWNPPFNSHIRHTGYQVAAGLSLLAPFLLTGFKAGRSYWGPFLILLVLCTFIFWMGGRGSVLGVYLAFALLAIALWLSKVPSRQMWLGVGLATLVGLFLSELLAIADWNGILDLVARTATSADINELSTGRSRLWATAWESLQGHLAFGLGPQGYFFMPNRIMGVQPHAVVVQFVVEWGLIGTALAGALLLFGFLRGLFTYVVHRDGPPDIAALSAGTLVTALTVHALFDGTYYHPQPSLYLAIGLAIWTLPKQRKSAKN